MVKPNSIQFINQRTSGPVNADLIVGIYLNIDAHVHVYIVLEQGQNISKMCKIVKQKKISDHFT